MPRTPEETSNSERSELLCVCILHRNKQDFHCNFVFYFLQALLGLATRAGKLISVVLPTVLSGSGVVMSF